MCGIFGYSSSNNNQETSFLHDSIKSMKHRGPDGFGYEISTTHGLGMVRLRIRSCPSEKQPISIKGNTKAAFNGEIYQDEQGNVPSGGRGEVESIIASSTEHGVSGMFSLAWTSDGNTLYLQRDAFGIKPLFIRVVGDVLYFSSEVKPLLSLTKRIRLDKQAVIEYLAYGRQLSQGGFYEDIQPVQPGSKLSITNGIITSVEMNSVTTMIESGHQTSPPDDLREVRASIRQSILQSLPSDRKVGVAVSGGLDSTILCHELAELGMEGLSLVSIKADGSGDGISDIDELGIKADVHKSWDIATSYFYSSEYLSELREAISIILEPSRMSSLPLYLRLAKLAKKNGITVLLLGEGADELFCGYRSYIPLKEGAPLSHFVFTAKAREYMRRLLSDSDFTVLTKALDAKLEGLPSSSKWGKLRSLEATFSLEPLLHRADHLLMSQSIEGRTPFLHGETPEMAFSFGGDELLSDSQTKVVLRKAYDGFLPDAFQTEIKRPFRAPFVDWLSSDLKEEVAQEVGRAVPFLISIGVSECGVWHTFDHALQGCEDACRLIFCLLSFSIWLQEVKNITDVHI